MGAFLDKPKTEKHNEGGTGNGLRYGLCSMQGWRVEMEDAHTAVVSLPQTNLKDWSFFAVFDGHAGAKVSAYCAEDLLKSITQNEDFKGKPDVTDGTEVQPSIEDVTCGIKTGFLTLDEKMRKLPEVISGEDKSGSTAVCSIISPKNIFFANCGDSRAVLCRNGKCAFATQDHKPVNPIEKERIQNAGGSVMIQRVNGSLAVSRALGDFEYKNVEGKGPCEQLVSPEPEVFLEERNKDDQFLVLACDGIWDVMTNDELCSFVEHRMKIHNSLEEVCNQVVDTCLIKGSRDNMSIVLIAFEGAPKVSEEYVKKDKELDERIEAKVKDILEKEPVENHDFGYVLHAVAEELHDQFPPGGGFQSKKTVIENVYHRLKPNAEQDESDLP